MSADLSDLPAGWASASLVDVAAGFQYGYTASAIERTDGPRLLRITDIQDGAVEWATVPSCEIDSGELSKYALAMDDIVFARTGATTGKSFLIHNCPDQAVFASYLIRLRAAEGMEPRYLYYYFQTNDYWSQIASEAAGIAQPGVNATKLRKLTLPVAPREEQTRIVGVTEAYLTRLDAAVAGLERAQANLKRYRASVLQSAVEGRLVPTEAELAREEGRDYEPAEVLLDRILTERRHRWEEAELERLKAKGKPPTNDKWRSNYKEPVVPAVQDLPELPEGWCWATTDQLFWFVTSGSRGWARYYSDTGATFIRIGNLDHDSISLDLSEIQHVRPPEGAEGTRTRVEPGDVLISITADVGMVGLVRDRIGEAYINQHVSLARPVPSGCLPYLAWFLAAPDGGQRQFLALQRGATKVGLGLGDIRGVNVPLPPLGEQQRIVNEVERCVSLATDCENTASANELRCQQMRQSILSWAFTGKLVDQDPADESPDVLIERIRKKRDEKGTSTRRGKR